MSAPPQLFVENADDEFDYETNAVEVIDNHAPTSSSFTATEQDSTISYFIPANMKRSALRFFLTYAYSDDQPPYALHRELPARHPLYGNQFCFAASVTDMAPKSEDANPNGEPYLFSPFEGSKDEEMRYASYQKSVISLKYKSWGRMKFLPDSDIADYKQEFNRFTTFDTEPSIEALSATGSAFIVFREGGGINQPEVGKTPFEAPIPELMGKIALQMTWHFVPFNHVSLNENILDLRNIFAILGTVNGDDFLDFPIGTLLLRAVKVEPVLFPVTTANPSELATGAHIQGIWEYFNPLRAKLYDPVTAPYLGHRLFPWRQGGGSVAAGGNGGIWYYANRTDGSEYIPLANHWTFFKNVNDPS